MLYLVVAQPRKKDIWTVFVIEEEDVESRRSSLQTRTKVVFQYRGKIFGRRRSSKGGVKKQNGAKLCYGMSTPEE